MRARRAAKSARSSTPIPLRRCKALLRSSALSDDIALRPCSTPVLTAPRAAPSPASRERSRATSLRRGLRIRTPSASCARATPGGDSIRKKAAALSGAGRPLQDPTRPWPVETDVSCTCRDRIGAVHEHVSSSRLDACTPSGDRESRPRCPRPSRLPARVPRSWAVRGLDRLRLRRSHSGSGGLRPTRDRSRGCGGLCAVSRMKKSGRVEWSIRFATDRRRR